MAKMELWKDKDAGYGAGPLGGQSDGAGGVAGGVARQRGPGEAGAQGLARREEEGWPRGPAPPLLTLPVAQGLGPQREARGRQRRLQQEQAGPRH